MKRNKKKNKKVGIISLGCPKNTVDSERILGELHALGWEITSDKWKADCLIVNTCGFIKEAITESEEALAEICEVKAKKPDVILVATGCLPQRIPRILGKRFPQLDLIVGVGRIEKLPALIESKISGKETLEIQGNELETPGRATLSPHYAPRLRITPPWTAYMKIAEGCSHECAFCTIPSIKGPYISRPPDDLIIEAENLASEGVKELILVSQDTTAYGSDIGTNLRTLLKELDQLEGIKWIRLHYLYPSKISEGLIELIANSKHLIPYFDAPLQHVSPKILKLMRRLDPEIDALSLVNRIRRAFANTHLPACIRSTFIVGFPGETEEDFQMLMDFLSEAMLDRVSVFEFSSEDGTAAATMPDEVPKHITESRFHRLMEIQHDISQEINEGWIGRTTEVLIEGTTEDGMLAARSYRDAPEIDGLVLITGAPESVEGGTFALVRITEALPYDLKAEWLEPLE